MGGLLLTVDDFLMPDVREEREDSTGVINRIQWDSRVSAASSLALMSPPLEFSVFLLPPCRIHEHRPGQISAVAVVQYIGPLNPSRTGLGSSPQWSR